MPVIEQHSRFRGRGMTIMEGLLAWERLPWLLRPWVQAFEVQQWAATGWRGQLELRDHEAVCASLALSRQQGQALLRLGDLAQAELDWEQAAPDVCALARSVRAEDPRVLRCVDWGLRRLLHVAVVRARLLGRRIDGAGVPAQRCCRCLGPLVGRSGSTGRHCAWAGHEPIPAA